MRKLVWIMVLAVLGAIATASAGYGGILSLLGWGRKSRPANSASTGTKWTPGPNASGYTGIRAQKATYHAAGASRDGYDAGQAHRTGYQGQRATRSGYGPTPSAGYR